jgi:autotransporter-associated beta strand protein
MTQKWARLPRNGDSSRRRRPTLERLEDRAVPTAYSWINSGGGDWTDPMNWVPLGSPAGPFPNAPDDVAILGSALLADGTITIPDGVTITVGGIQIDDDNNYTIAGAGTGNLVLTGPSAAPATLSVTNSGGNGAHTLAVPITLGSFLNVSQASTGVLTLAGTISGSDGLSLDGPGTLRLAGTGDNTYGGFTFVRSGVLELNKTGAVAVPNTLFPGDFSGPPGEATVRLLQPDQIADGAVVFVDDDGQLDLNGQNETISELSVGALSTGGGLLTVTGLTTVRGTDAADVMIAQFTPTSVTWTVNGGTAVTVQQPGGFSLEGLGGDDVTVFDFTGGFRFLPDGLMADGGGGNDAVRLIGTGTSTGSYLPAAFSFGSGRLTITQGGQTTLLRFGDFEPAEVSAMASFTFTTPNSADTVSVTDTTATDSMGTPVAANLIAGTSDGAPFESLSFF